MKTMYKMGICGYRMRSRNIPVVEDIPSGWYGSEETAEVKFKEYQENRLNEYEKLQPQAMEILKQKELRLMETIESLGCDVFTSAEAHDDTGIESCLTLEISLAGKFGLYSYASDIRI